MNKALTSHPVPARFYSLPLALAGGALVTLSTRFGAGIGGDATTYIFSAKNLLEGRGLGLVGPQGEFSFLALFPPGFPLTLSALGLAGLDLFAAVRWLNVLLFVLLILTGAEVVRRASGSALAGVGAALLTAVSPALVPVYSSAVSEPLALFLGFAALGLLLAYLRPDGGSRRLLVVSALLAAYSFLTRYASAAFVGTALLALLFSSRPVRRRLADSALYAAIAGLPMAVWLVVDYLNTDSISSRAVERAEAMVGRAVDFWPQLGKVLLSWLAPASWIEAPFYPAVINRLLPLLLAGGTLLAAGLALRWLSRKGAEGPQADAARLLRVLLLFSGLYLLVIYAVYVVTVPVISVNNRMMAPLHAAWLWTLPLLVWTAAERLPRLKWAAPVLALALVGFAAWSGVRTARITADAYARGLDFNTETWRTSELLQAVRELPEDVLLVTNETAGLLYATGRAAYPLEEPARGVPLPDFPRYGDGDLTDDLGQQLFRQGDALLVLFNTIYEQYEPLYGDQAVQRVEALKDGLECLHESLQGVILRYPQP